MPRGVGLTRVTIVEDHDLFAEALDLAITLQGHQVQRVSALGPGTTHVTLLQAVLRQRPEVVLLDLDLGPAADGGQLVRPLTEEGVPVVVLSATRDPSRLGQCLAEGARAVVPKWAELNSIIGGIRCVVAGLPAMDRGERERLLASYAEEHRRIRETRAALASLSRREGEVLGRLMDGVPVSDIARSSYVSEATVRTQVKSIRAKLGVTSQLAAVGAARRARWQPPPRGE
ncbi:response regulator transcription factor [Nocardioides pyridinolyticus]